MDAARRERSGHDQSHREPTGLAHGRFAAALTPSSALGERLASLPVSPQAIPTVLETTQDLVQVGPALEALQLVSTVGAVTSVANVGISIVGFAVALKRLNRIEGKLDQMMTTPAGPLDVLSGQLRCWLARWLPIRLRVLRPSSPMQNCLHSSGIPAHEILRLMKEASGVDVLALGQVPR